MRRGGVEAEDVVLYSNWHSRGDGLRCIPPYSVIIRRLHCFPWTTVALTSGIRHPSQCGRECSCRSASVAPPSRKVVSLHSATFHPVSGPSDARSVPCRAAAPCAPGIRPRAALQVRDDDDA